MAAHSQVVTRVPSTCSTGLGIPSSGRSTAGGPYRRRTVFSSDEQRCAEGLQSPRHYRYDTDSNGTFRKAPLHDWASDGADAFRYFAVAMREPSRRSKPLKILAAMGEHAWMAS